MPTIRQITLPDGVTYDLAATAINREVVPIVTEYSGSETTFNALEVTEDESQHTVYNINLPNNTPLISWVDTADGTIIQSPEIYFNVQYDNNSTATFLKYDGSYHSMIIGNSNSDTPIAVRLEGDTSVYGEFKPMEGVYFNSTALPERNGQAYLLGIDAFSEGGQMKWSTAAHVTVGRASTAGAVDRAYFGNQAYETHDCNGMTYNGLFYYNANGPSTAIGASTNDGAIYSQAYNTTWVGQIAQDYRNGSLFVRGKNNGTWKAWKHIIDSGTVLRYLGYTTSSIAKNFAMTSDAVEIVIACKFNADNTKKMFCTSVPKNLLEGAYGTKYEVWVGGGKNTAATGNSGAARVLVNVSLASATVVTVQGIEATSGSSNYLSGAYIYVYQR